MNISRGHCQVFTYFWQHKCIYLFAFAELKVLGYLYPITILTLVYILLEMLIFTLLSGVFPGSLIAIDEHDIQLAKLTSFLFRGLVKNQSYDRDMLVFLYSTHEHTFPRSILQTFKDIYVMTSQCARPHPR